MVNFRLTTFQTLEKTVMETDCSTDGMRPPNSMLKGGSSVKRERYGSAAKRGNWGQRREIGY
jgi:hypothetical protein